MQHKFDVYFSGEILEGHDIQEVKEAIGRLFKLSDDKLEALFSGKLQRIKKDLNVEQSGQLRGIFRKAGAVIHIVPAGESFKPSAPRNVAETPDLWSLMPAGADLAPLARNTGKEIDLPKTHIDGIKIAPVGPLPAEPPPADAEIDTSHLHAAPAKSGSLEEFAVRKESVPIPDISNLDIVNNDKPLQEQKQRPAEPLPDISHMKTAPPKSGSLEQFAQKKKPVPIPDISKLSLDD